MTTRKKKHLQRHGKGEDRGKFRNWFKLVIPTVLKGVYNNARNGYAEIRKKNPAQHMQALSQRVARRVTNDINSLRPTQRQSKTLHGRNH